MRCLLLRASPDVIVHRQLLGGLATPKKEELFNNESLSALADHINKKHRTSKFAQKDSSQLFQAFYFRDRKDQVRLVWSMSALNISIDKPQVEDGIIYAIKANGFLVFVPKYAVKGPVYLKDRSGKLAIPDNALSLSPDTYTSSYKVTPKMLFVAEIDAITDSRS